MKRRKRHNPEQIVKKLHDAERRLNAGQSIGQVCQALEISEATFHRWRNQYGGMKAEEAKRLKELEIENTRLKKMVAGTHARQRDPEGHRGGKLLSPARRRDAVDMVVEKHEVSERRACCVAGQHRSTQRYEPVERNSDEVLVKRIHELVASFPRYGYRRIAAELQGEGWDVNVKRVHRLWKREGLRVPRKRRKKGVLGDSSGSCSKKRSDGLNDVWSYDFVFDRLSDGRMVKILAVVDEFSRECLALEAGFRFTGKDVLDVLGKLMLERGSPKFIRSDNGSEFTALKVRNWLSSIEVGTLFIEPGSPWENGFVESFNSRLRDEFLNMEIFYGLGELKKLASKWKEYYNTKRRHSSLNNQTPSERAAFCRTQRIRTCESSRPPKGVCVRRTSGETLITG
ncbi:MAG: IS3 family transposase [Planctomycetota bacterium]|nr:IS3 family transposase [Planctomycetota bacterium]